ncbi:MAG: CBS domain-containing protein [Spirochaetes bacterium]|nr:MAG: CBS domain-containing protein [Spirochaetota bacterium]
MEEKREENKELREFHENPYNPERKKPEDIVRIFYIHNVPIIPVVSKRGGLLGIIRKEDVVSELSDIERTRDQRIDKFVSHLAKKMTLDDLLPYVAVCREFVVVSIFGEVEGRWTRLELLAACESPQKARVVENDIEKQKELQMMEWMIYMILEHVPRALYAVNKQGKTIFYNHYFEELYAARKSGEVDTGFVEKALGDAAKNEFFPAGKKGGEMYFYNQDLKMYYEKLPMLNNNKTVGYLIYCSRHLNESAPVKKRKRKK